MSKIIGIDLGTTNSCVAVMEGNEPVVITNPLFSIQTATYLLCVDTHLFVVIKNENRYPTIAETDYVAEPIAAHRRAGVLEPVMITLG